MRLRDLAKKVGGRAFRPNVEGVGGELASEGRRKDGRGCLAGGPG